MRSISTSGLGLQINFKSRKSEACAHKSDLVRCLVGQLTLSALILSMSTILLSTQSAYAQKQIAITNLSNSGIANTKNNHQTLCNAQEDVVFSCQVGNGKFFSFCAGDGLSKDEGYLLYKFGRIGHSPELSYPQLEIKKDSKKYHHPSKIFQFNKTKNEFDVADPIRRTIRFQPDARYDYYFFNLSSISKNKKNISTENFISVITNDASNELVTKRRCLEKSTINNLDKYWSILAN
jgi:hypothetical protein